MSLRTLLPRKWQEKCEREGKGPLSLQFIADERELDDEGLYDPIGDQNHKVCDGLIHRYQNRVLFLPTNKCPVICRYCFRKHEIEKDEKLFLPDMNEVMDYLRDHQEVEEIIFSGGDPFSLSNDKLAFYLDHFSSLSHIKWIRFHTRYPTMVPKRFNQELIDLLNHYTKKFQKICLMTHINHWDEWDQEIEELFLLLSKSSLSLYSQTVLLKGVNNSLPSLKTLFENLSERDIQPYYLHHPDLTQGGKHFYLSLDEGRKLYHQLRDELPGWMIPQYIIDIPHGFGKIPATNADQGHFRGELVDKNGKVHLYSPEIRS